MDSPSVPTTNLKPFYDGTVAELSPYLVLFSLVTFTLTIWQTTVYLKELVLRSVSVSKHRPATLALRFCLLELSHTCATLLGAYYYSQHPDVRFSDTQSLRWSWKVMFLITTLISFMGQFSFIYAGYCLTKKFTYFDTLTAVIIGGLFLDSIASTIFGQWLGGTIGGYLRIGPAFQGSAMNLNMILCSMLAWRPYPEPERSETEGNYTHLTATTSNFLALCALLLGLTGSGIAVFGCSLNIGPNDKYTSFTYIIANLFAEEFLGTLFPVLIIYALRTHDNSPSTLPSLFFPTRASLDQQLPWKVETPEPVNEKNDLLIEVGNGEGGEEEMNEKRLGMEFIV